MTTTRDHVLARVRRNQPAWRELPPLPAFARRLDDPLATFTAALTRMGGTWGEAPAGRLDAFIRARFPDARVVCSATPEVEGTRPIGAIRASWTTSMSASCVPSSASPRPARCG